MEDKLVLSDKNQQLIEIYDDRPSNLTYVSSDSPPSSLIFGNLFYATYCKLSCKGASFVLLNEY